MNNNKACNESLITYFQTEILMVFFFVIGYSIHNYFKRKYNKRNSSTTDFYSDRAKTENIFTVGQKISEDSQEELRINNSESDIHQANDLFYSN